MFRDLLADLQSGHNLRQTVFVQCFSMYRVDGPRELRSLGETEFVNGVAAMSASGGYGDARACTGIVGMVDLRLGSKAADVLSQHVATGGELAGTHRFLAFAVQGTAPSHDDHRCTIAEAAWRDRPHGLLFEIEANRFLHHMVRFLVGTMIEIARGRRPAADFAMLLAADDNRRTSAPAPPHALFLDVVRYPRDLYLDDT